MTTLAPLSLDDLTFEDLRLMALRRIPAASGGRWTHHAPVDAGVTLLELFAFLLEQQLFVLDQVPDNLTYAILALLGEAPREAGIARTAVAPIRETLKKSRRLTAATAIRPADAGLSELVFTTWDDSLLLPIAAQEVFADGAPVSDRLERGEAVPLMATGGAPGSVAVELRLTQAIQAADIGDRISVALILDGAGVPPQWDAATTDVPPPGPLTFDWAVPVASGRFEDWHDGTRGLRRSGLIGFTLPAETEGANRLRLTLGTDAAAHAEPPRLAAVAVGAAIAEHRRGVEIADHNTGDAGHDRMRAALKSALDRLLPISGQTLDLPAALAQAIGPSLALRLADAAGDLHDWAPVADLTPMGPEDRVFTFDRALGRVFFGDGYAGRVPAPITNFSLSVDLGGGAEGNHAAGMVWRLQDTTSNLRLRSLASAVGGTEPETLDEARARVVASLAQRHRAVTAEDYVALTETTPGIGPHRAHVMPGHDPAFPCRYIADSITVFVVPKTGPEVPAPRADEGALAVIRGRLDEARMLTMRVFVRHPPFRPVGLLIEIAAATGEPETFADRLRPVLSAYLHPAIGGPGGTGWPFGRSLRPSELVRVIEAALPPGTRVERVAIRLTDTDGNEEDCTQLAVAAADLVRLDRLTVRVRRDAPPETTL